MQLTSLAKKIVTVLIVGNILIGVVGIIFYQYLLLTSLRPPVTPRVLNDIGRFVYQLKTQPQAFWPEIVKRRSSHWLMMSLSKQAKYKNHAMPTLKPDVNTILAKKVNVSLPLAPYAWLNISINNHKHKNTLGLFIMLFIIWVSALCVLCYWAVKRLNNPIRTLIESLDYAKDQHVWQPIPLVGEKEQKAIFSKVNELQEKVNKFLNDRTHMLAAISHDLRTPLTRIKLRLEYLSGSEHQQKLEKDVKEMEMMLNESLDYFRDINTNEKQQHFDLVALLQAICEDAKDLNFNVKFISNLDKLVYLGQLNLLKRAFDNLLNNAIYYGEQALVSLRVEKNTLEVTIEDKGCGLTKEQMQQVFSPFYRVEKSRSREFGGTGLGLTIAKEIIQRHKGTINLSNRIEGGLKVMISLPLEALPE
jgi:signal transduction histidine kinase